MNHDEAPNTVHGRLLESVHLSGYSFERACAELEWLLDDDRWKRVGSGFDDIEAFLATLNFSALKGAVEQRKKIAKRLADLAASQRQTARLLGVDKETVARDLGKRNGANAPRQIANSPTVEPSTGANAPVWFQADVDPSTAAKRVVQREARETERAETFSAKVAAIKSGELPATEYDVICADPPWSYDNAGFDQSAANHYPTMDVDAICALPQTDPTFPKFADTAVLFLWATAPLLPSAFDVMTAWGFCYKTKFVWVKDRAPGLGWWAQSKHEDLLIGHRGEPMSPMELVDNVITADVSTHSRKPDEAYARIDRMFPGLRRVEVFARQPRAGWAVWGNEV